MNWVKLILTVLRVLIVALWKDEKGRELIVRFFHKVFGVTNYDLLTLVRTNKHTPVLKMPSPSFVFAECKRLKLLASEQFYTLTEMDFASFWNGMGPNSWSGTLREFVSDRLPEILPCSGPHDEWFTHSDGTHDTWKRTMDEWKTNSSICINDAYPIGRVWAYHKRTVAWVKAQIVIQVLEATSRVYWIAAKNRE